MIDLIQGDCLEKMTDIDYSKIKYGVKLKITNFEYLDDEEIYSVFLVDDCAGNGNNCVVVDMTSFEVVADFASIDDFLNYCTVLEVEDVIQ